MDAATADAAVNVPAFYANGFQLGLSNSDVNLLLTLSNQPSVMINLSYTTAKTLHLALRDMISTLESVTSREIMTTKEVAAGLEKLQKESPESGTKQ